VENVTFVSHSDKVSYALDALDVLIQKQWLKIFPFPKSKACTVAFTW